MNNQRRKQLEKISGQIEDLKSEIESIKDDEQDYYDNMPESLQGGDKGQNAEAAIEFMDNAIASLDEAIDYINESTN